LFGLRLFFRAHKRTGRADERVTDPKERGTVELERKGSRITDARANVSPAAMCRVQIWAQQAKETILANSELFARAIGRAGIDFLPRGAGHDVRPRAMASAAQRALAAEDHERVGRIANAVHEQLVGNASMVSGFRGRFTVDFDPGAPDFNILIGPTR
jgi:hypothetical protein